MKRIFSVALLFLSLISLPEIGESMGFNGVCGTGECTRNRTRVRRQCTRNRVVRASCSISRCDPWRWRCISSSQPATPTAPPTMTPTSSPTPSASMTPSPSPSTSPVPTQATGYTSGDPHIKTYDNLHFDCQAAGEFILSKSIGTPAVCSGFEVHGRFRAERPGTFTLSSGIAASEDNAPVVQFSINTDLTRPSMTIVGCPVVAFVDGVFRSFSHGDTTIGSAQNTIIVRDERTLTAHFPSGMRIQITVDRKFGCYFSKMVVTIPGLTIANCQIVGLFGTPNGRGNDDFTDGNGNILPLPTYLRDRQATDFCVNNWGVRAGSQSLFDFEAGDSFQTAAEADSLTTEGPDIGSATQNLRDICEGNEECLIDGILVDEELAATTLQNEREAEALAMEPIFVPMAPTDAPMRLLDTSKFVKKGYGSFYSS